MAEYRYYLIPDAMTRAFPEQFGKQTPTEFFDNIADLEKRYHQLREMPYNNERTWNERTRFPYARLVVGIDRQNPDGAVAIIQVRNGVNYLCDDYRGPYADRSDAQIPQMAKKLVEVIGVDRVRPHTYTQRDGYTWVQVEKDCHKNKPRNYRVQRKVLFGAISPPAGLLCCGCGAGDCDLLCLSALAADGYAGRFLYRHGGGAAFFWGWALSTVMVIRLKSL